MKCAASLGKVSLMLGILFELGCGAAPVAANNAANLDQQMTLADLQCREQPRACDEKARATAAMNGTANTAPRAPKKTLTWEHSEEKAVAMAKAENRPLMVDFTADWCNACKQMAKETFADPRVIEKAAHFVAVKVDATNDEDPQIKAVLGKYKVVGLPTLVLYDSKGNERGRFNDFIGPDVFLAAIEGID